MKCRLKQSNKNKNIYPTKANRKSGFVIKIEAIFKNEKKTSFLKGTRGAADPCAPASTSPLKNSSKIIYRFNCLPFLF